MAFWSKWFQHKPFAPWESPRFEDSKDTVVVLESVRQYVEEQAYRELQWYAKSQRRAGRISRWLRFAAIILSATGGIVPALVSMNVLTIFRTQYLPDSFSQIDFGQLGYICLASAAAMVLFDKLFGFSTAWMRSVTVLLAIERMREDFRLGWIGLTRRLSTSKEESERHEIIATMLDLGKTFLVKIKEQSEKETQAWVNEFQTNLAQFEKDLRAQLEAGRPGGIDVKVTDADKAPDGFDLTLDQMVVERITGTSGSIGFVAPGLHKVSVAARVKDKTYTSSQMITVNPAAITVVELKLGISASTSPSPQPPPPSKPAPVVKPPPAPPAVTPQTP